MATASAKSADRPTLNLTIIVEQPVRGVAYALQRGRAELEQIQIAADVSLRFLFDVNLRTLPDGTFDLRGEHVQGPRGGRFVYINSGMLAGQHSCWTRRAKVTLMPLTTLASAAGRFEARFAGRGRDGGPSCATVPLLGVGWCAGG